MAFLRLLFGKSAKNKRDYPNIRRGLDPLEHWTKTKELGDGSFGKVYQVRKLLVEGGPGGLGRNGDG